MSHQQVVADVPRLEDDAIPQKTSSVTATFEPSYGKLVKGIFPPENANTSRDYILAEITEKSIQDSIKEWKTKALLYLSGFVQHRSFKEAKKGDILGYLKAMGKSKVDDPQYRWIGDYKNRPFMYHKFFSWLYNPDGPNQKKRMTPPCMKRLRRLRSKEKSPYKPFDFWTAAEQGLFLTYCLSKSDSCYAAMARDTSAIPCELLILKVGDIFDSSKSLPLAIRNRGFRYLGRPRRAHYPPEQAMSTPSRIQYSTFQFLLEV